MLQELNSPGTSPETKPVLAFHRSTFSALTRVPRTPKHRVLFCGWFARRSDCFWAMKFISFFFMFLSRPHFDSLALYCRALYWGWVSRVLSHQRDGRKKPHTKPRNQKPERKKPTHPSELDSASCVVQVCASYTA